MTGAFFEEVLARLYVDDAFRDSFLASPEQFLATLPLSNDERAALAAIDVQGLLLAAQSFASKRAGRARRG